MKEVSFKNYWGGMLIPGAKVHPTLYYSSMWWQTRKYLPVENLWWNMPEYSNCRLMSQLSKVKNRVMMIEKHLKRTVKKWNQFDYYYIFAHTLKEMMPCTDWGGYIGRFILTLALMNSRSIVTCHRRHLWMDNSTNRNNQWDANMAVINHCLGIWHAVFCR